MKPFWIRKVNGINKNDSILVKKEKNNYPQLSEIIAAKTYSFY